MISIKLLIRDTEYLEGFVRALASSNAAVFAETVSELKIDDLAEKYIVLTDYLKKPDGIPDELARRIVHLNDKRNPEIDTSTDRYIYKYDTFSGIISALCIIYSEIFNEVNKNKMGKGLIYTVCNLSENIEIGSEYPKLIARQVAYMKRQDVLLIPAKFINHYRCTHERDYLIKLVYCLQRNQQVGKNAFFYEDEYGVNYIKMNTVNNRITELNVSELSWFIESLQELFPIIVVDIGECFTEQNIKVLHMSDRIFCAGNNETETLKYFSEIEQEKIFTIRVREGRENCEMAILEALEKITGG